MGFSLVVVCGLLSSYGAQAPEHTASVVVAHELSSCGVWLLSSCGVQALCCSVWASL